MTENDWTCEKVEQYLQDSWGLKARRGDLRDIANHLKSCPNHREEALAELRLAALLVEDREAVSVPPLLRQKVYALKPLLRKRAMRWRVWGLRLALAVAALVLVVWGLVGRPKTGPLEVPTEPNQFEEVFFASGAEPDETVSLWVEASYTVP
jgi:predicted anti-sigma-YlaC factor YlaD